MTLNLKAKIYNDENAAPTSDDLHPLAQCADYLKV
jgi:hypothetical protein